MASSRAPPALEDEIASPTAPPSPAPRENIPPWDIGYLAGPAVIDGESWERGRDRSNQAGWSTEKHGDVLAGDDHHKSLRRDDDLEKSAASDGRFSPHAHGETTEPAAFNSPGHNQTVGKAAEIQIDHQGCTHQDHYEHSHCHDPKFHQALSPPNAPTLPLNSHVKGRQTHDAPTAKQGSLISFPHGKRSSSSMKPQLYRAATMGNTCDFSRQEDLKLVSLPVDIEKTPGGNTALHLAASSGHHRLAQHILGCSPELAITRNSSGQLALHLAAAAGHLSTVSSMVDHHRHAQRLAGAENGGLDFDVLQENDEDGNTPLHLAVKNGHQEVAEFLFDKNPEVSTRPNRHQMSPLSMAAEAGHSQLVNRMLEKAQTEIPVTAPMRGKSLLHAAIKGRKLEVLEALIKFQPTNLCTFDDKGRTPLSFAASIGYIDVVSYFLQNATCEAAYTEDEDGSFPIHQASSKGHVNILEVFFKLCPDSVELLNKKAQNILHLAARSGKASVVSYILKKTEHAMLVNEKDEDGNTPLHLAAMGGHARVVSILTRDKRVNLEHKNSAGCTALDAVECFPEPVPSFQKRLAWQALRYAGAPRTPGHQDQQSEVSKESYSMENYKDRINTLVLVAILVATLTFGAGFTMPGGENNSDPHQGMASLVKKRMFHIFLIGNTIALYSSIMAAIVLIWALLNDLSLSIASLKLAVPLLGLSLSMVSLAFMAGVYQAVSNLTWLAIIVLVVGSISLLILWVIFVPLLLPLTVKRSLSRRIFSNLLYPLILATESNDKKYA